MPVTSATEYRRPGQETSSLIDPVRSSPGTHQARRPIEIAVYAALTALYYGLLVTNTGRDIFNSSLHGMIFNSMALHLLHGQFDVSPDAVSFEAFTHNGKTYAYFGILPALLRMPLAPFVDLASVDLARLYSFLAMLTGAAGHLLAVIATGRAMPAGPGRAALLPRLAIAAVFSGPAVMLSRNVAVYNEAILWAWALAMWFIALALPALFAPGRWTTARLAALAILAGLCLLTRPTMGMGLLLAMGLLLMWLALKGGEPAPRHLLSRMCDRQILVPAGLVLVFALLAGGVNLARWGNPFIFADLRMQTLLLENYPDRLTRLDSYGLFNLRRLPFGIIYYLAPIWIFRGDGKLLFHDDIVNLFDAFELPPSSFLISDPLTVWLALLGVLALLRGTSGLPSRAPAAALLAGLLVPPALMLMAWYMAFRYRVEFAPLLTLAACLGAAVLARRLDAAPERRRRMTTALVALLLVAQVVSANLHALLYLASPFGPIHVLQPDINVLEFYRPEFLPSVFGR